MRQSRVIAILLLLLCAGGVVAWLIASGPSRDAANAAPISDLPANLDGATPLNAEPRNAESRDPRPGNDSEPERRPRPDRTTPREPETRPETEPGPDDWVIKGRLRFAEGLPLDTATLFHGSWVDAWILFRDESGENPEVRDLSPEVTGDGSFRVVCSESELPFVPRDGKVPAGRWQVSCTLDSELPSLFDVGEDFSIEQLRGLVTPTISGHVIDFGEITLEHNDLFGEQWIVTGRIVHVSGRALANCGELMLAVMQDDDAAAECYISTDLHGRFAAMLWDEEQLAGDPAQWVARLFNEEDGLYELSQYSRSQRLDVELPRPQVKGRVADFGEIRVAGALIEVEAEMEGLKPDLLPDGRLVQSSWAPYSGWTGTLDLHDGYHDLGATLYPSPAKAMLWVHEGRYEYTAELWVDDCYYPEQRGIVTARDGEVVPLKLKLPRYKIIPLQLETPDNAVVRNASISWSALKGEEEVVHVGYTSGLGPHTVPVFPGLVTEVSVEVEGFAPASATATDKDEKLLIKLTPAPAGVATLRVAVPEFPAEVSAQVLGATLNVVRIEKGEGAHSSGCMPGEVRVPVPAAGRYRVTLNGGGAYGYPGVLSGPVDVDIKEGDEAVVELPAIGPPPWSAYISGYMCNVRCAGRAIAVEADVFIGGGDQATQLAMRTGQRFSLAAPPLALPDGDARVPLELATATQPGEYATVSLDLEARIEVTVSRHGQDVKEFSATVDSKNAAGRGVYMIGDEQGGTVLLWAQPGTGTVLVDVEGREFTKTVEVRRGELAHVEFELDLVRVQFELGLPEDHDYPGSYSDLPAPWSVFRLHESGEEELLYLWDDRDELMDPGRYRVVPGYGDPALAVEFDISDGKDRVVKLPELPQLRLFSVRLKFDTAFFGDKLFEANIRICPAARLTRPDTGTYASWVQSRSVSDGIELMGVPGDTELVITGSTWIEEESSLNTWLLKPLRVRITSDGTVLPCTWTRGVPTAEEWWGLSAWSVSALPGLYIQLEDLEVLLPGRQELVFTDGAGTEVAREWVEVSAGTEVFEIPATLRATLEAKGLLEPTQPDEMPPDEE